MQQLAQFFSQGQLGPVETAIFLVVFVWSTAWKGIALWKSSKNNQLYWFIAIFLLSTLGLLEIIYLVFFQEKKEGKKA